MAAGACAVGRPERGAPQLCVGLRADQIGQAAPKEKASILFLASWVVRNSARFHARRGAQDDGNAKRADVGRDAGRSTADDTTNVDTPPLARRDSNVKQEIWDPEGICIIAGAGGMALAEEISGIIGLPSSSCLQARKADGESHIRLGANVRGRDVFVVQSTCTPANANVVELALILSACKRASARRA